MRHHVADGVVEEEVIARGHAMKVRVEREVIRGGGVEQRGVYVLSVHLHKTVSKLIVLFEQQFFAGLPKVVVARYHQLQRFFGA